MTADDDAAKTAALEVQLAERIEYLKDHPLRYFDTSERRVSVQYRVAMMLKEGGHPFPFDAAFDLAKAGFLCPGEGDGNEKESAFRGPCKDER